MCCCHRGLFNMCSSFGRYSFNVSKIIRIYLSNEKPKMHFMVWEKKDFSAINPYAIPNRLILIYFDDILYVDESEVYKKRNSLRILKLYSCCCLISVFGNGKRLQFRHNKSFQISFFPSLSQNVKEMLNKPKKPQITTRLDMPHAHIHASAILNK